MVNAIDHNQLSRIYDLPKKQAHTDIATVWPLIFFKEKTGHFEISVFPDLFRKSGKTIGSSGFAYKLSKKIKVKSSILPKNDTSKSQHLSKIPVLTSSQLLLAQSKMNSDGIFH